MAKTRAAGEEAKTATSNVEWPPGLKAKEEDSDSTTTPANRKEKKRIRAEGHQRAAGKLTGFVDTERKEGRAQSP